jgi:CRP-like cAMP-binding protein
MDPSRLVRLYTEGERADVAYIVVRGPLYISFGDGPATEIPARNIVVGTLEFFLPRLLRSNEEAPRLFNLYLHPQGKCTEVPMATVEKMISQLNFGRNTNIFLSEVLTVTNERYGRFEKRYASKLRPYNRRAEVLVKMVDVLREIAERYDSPELLEMVNEFSESEMYRDGSAYQRPHILQAILSPPTARSRFIELYKKNTMICREGSIAKQMYVLLNGKVSVSAGGTFVTYISEPGEAFGELSLFLGGRRTATLVAEEDSHLYVVEHRNVVQFVRQKSPTLFVNIAESLAGRILRNVRRIDRIEQMLLGVDANADSELQPAAVENLGEAEVALLLDRVRAYQERKPTSVIKAYIKQYAS